MYQAHEYFLSVSDPWAKQVKRRRNTIHGNGYKVQSIHQSFKKKRTMKYWNEIKNDEYVTKCLDRIQ